jgi:hypothetical protein
LAVERGLPRNDPPEVGVTPSLGVVQQFILNREFEQFSPITTTSTNHIEHTICAGEAFDPFERDPALGFAEPMFLAEMVWPYPLYLQCCDDLSVIGHHTLNGQARILS